MTRAIVPASVESNPPLYCHPLLFCMLSALLFLTLHLLFVLSSLSTKALTKHTKTKKSHFFFFSSSNMAVEARRIDLLPSQLISHRDFIKSNQVNANTQMDSFFPFAEPMPEQTMLPFYQAFDCNPISTKTSMDKADSGLTYNIPAPRKRQRDSINDLDAFSLVSQKQKLSGFSSLLDQDIIFRLQQQQSEIDRYIAQHTEKVILELEEQRKRQSRMLISAIQEGVANKLKEKDEEIHRMRKLNWVLQERVKSLFVENQIWRDLAQTNEATANTLRSNLEQVLAHVGGEGDDCAGGGATLAAAAEDDAESSCGSSDFGRSTIAGEGAQDKAVGGGRMLCRRCGEKESSVLLLPCRHLCLCTVCGSCLIGSCPVCNFVVDASLHVNLS